MSVCLGKSNRSEVKGNSRKNHEEGLNTSRGFGRKWQHLTGFIMEQLASPANQSSNNLNSDESPRVISEVWFTILHGFHGALPLSVLYMSREQKHSQVWAGSETVRRAWGEGKEDEKRKACQLTDRAHLAPARKSLSVPVRARVATALLMWYLMWWNCPIPVLSAGINVPGILVSMSLYCDVT